MRDMRNMRWGDLQTLPRLAGMVRRYHTHPVVTDPRVADHVYNMMRVWWLIWGPMPPHISTHLLWHDSGELVASDVCHHTKNMVPGLRATLRHVEADAVVQMGGPEEDVVSPYEAYQVKMCDLLEMYEFGMVEIAMGNNLAHTIINSCITAIKPLMRNLTTIDAMKVDQYIEKMYAAAATYGINIQPFYEADEVFEVTHRE